MHRTSVSWASIEPNAPVDSVHTYYWPDDTFNVYRNDRRLMPYVIVMVNPSWAAQRACGPIDLSHLDDFGEFVCQLVSRYADVTPYWVFYNEEDQWTTYPEGHDAGGCWGGHGDEYARMLAVAWDAAHSANPSAQVIFGAVAYEPAWDQGSTWDRFFLRDAFQYMRDHPDDYVDIIAANQYNFRRDDWDDGSSTLPENQEIIARFRQAVNDASFNPDVPGAYSIDRWQTEYGLNKPIATGEVGLQVGGADTEDDPITNDLQARHAVHVNVRGMAAGLKIISWYTLVDKPSELKYGLVRSDMTTRPAYHAYQVLTEQLDGYMFDQQLVLPGNSRIQAYRFDNNSGEKKLVLWRDSGEKLKSQDKDATETMTISAAELGAWTGQVRVTDKFGNTQVFQAPTEVVLEVSSDPVFVENVPATP